MLHNMHDKDTFPYFDRQQLELFQAHGEVVHFGDDQLVFSQGDKLWDLYVVISGKLRISKTIGNESTLLAYHGPGQFSGDLSILTGGVASATGRTVGPTTLLRVTPKTLRGLISECSPLAQMVLKAMAQRSREVDAHVNHEEKLAALGKMSAGLAHELNNPAAAARRASKLMLETILEAPLRMLELDPTWNPSQRELIRQTANGVRDRITQGFPKQDPIELSDREQSLYEWLEAHDMPRAADQAPPLAAASFSIEALDAWQQTLGCGYGFQKAINWLETVLRMAELAKDLETSTGRISELVQAMKEYTYMDQAKFQLIDIHKGLESTLKIMHHKLKGGVEVRRQYDESAPTICAYAGELNQVWTNLIDNAIDAMNGQGVLTIRTMPRDEGVVVELEDNGPGIPDEVRNRIFEPFFTTKEVGKGTGLGLDISYRIVTFRHGGHIQVRSKPGETVFSVYLPANPPKERDREAAVVSEGAAL
jgi:signal transduction histidine kinase